MSKFCGFCGATVPDDGAAFCPSCGATFQAAPAQNEAAAAPNFADNQNAAYANNAYGNAAPGNVPYPNAYAGVTSQIGVKNDADKKKKIIIIAAVAVFVLLLIIIFSNLKECNLCGDLKFCEEITLFGSKYPICKDCLSYFGY